MNRHILWILFRFRYLPSWTGIIRPSHFVGPVVFARGGDWCRPAVSNKLFFCKHEASYNELTSVIFKYTGRRTRLTTRTMNLKLTFVTQLLIGISISGMYRTTWYRLVFLSPVVYLQQLKLTRLDVTSVGIARRPLVKISIWWKTLMPKNVYLLTTKVAKRKLKVSKLYFLKKHLLINSFLFRKLNNKKMFWKKGWWLSKGEWRGVLLLLHEFVQQ